MEIDGDIVEKELAPGEIIHVDQGYIAAFDESVEFDITTVKGLKNKFLRVVLSSDEKNTLGQISESVFLYIILLTK